MFINISGQSVCDEAFVEFLLARLEQSDVDPSRLTFEITETATVANFSKATQFISALKEIGVDYVQGFGVQRPEGLVNFKPLSEVVADFDLDSAKKQTKPQQSTESV